MMDWCELQHQSLQSAAAVDFVHDPAAGGVAVFLGASRAERSESGRQLVALDYEAYQDMALAQLRQLAGRARQRWPMIVKIAILHRVGRVPLAQPSVCVAVSTPHRAQAFEACRWLIDSLKEEASIWKKEIWDDGAGSWV